MRVRRPRCYSTSVLYAVDAPAKRIHRLRNGSLAVFYVITNAEDPGRALRTGFVRCGHGTRGGWRFVESLNSRAENKFAEVVPLKARDMYVCSVRDWPTVACKWRLIYVFLLVGEMVLQMSWFLFFVLCFSFLSIVRRGDGYMTVCGRATRTAEKH